MDKHRDWKRPVIALAALGALTVAVLAAPAGAHFRPRDEKKHVKKIARRIAKKEATTIVQTTVGPTVFIEETELQRFGPLEATAGAAEATVTTFGDFTISLLCEGTAAQPRTRIQIATSANNALLQSDEDDQVDFDTAETDVDIHDESADVADAQDADTEESEFYVGNEAGTQFFDGKVQGAMNYSGSDCWATGWVFQIVPA